MRPRLLFLAFVALFSFGAALASESDDQRGPLRPMSACLDPERARSWTLLDSDQVLIDAGRKHYLLHLVPSCPELSYSHAVSFRSGNGVGRICGSVRDALIAARPGRFATRCAIAAVAPLSRDEYAAYASGKMRGRVSARETQ